MGILRNPDCVAGRRPFELSVQLLNPQMSLSRAQIGLFPKLLNHRIRVRAERFVIAILQILFNLFTKPTSLPIVWWLSSTE